MKTKQAQRLCTFFRKDLLENFLPFWGINSSDPLHGGFSNFLSRKGSKLSMDKGGIAQGKMTWLFSWVYNEIDSDRRWLEYSRIGAQFLKDSFFNSHGRGYALYKQDGTPAMSESSLYPEIFAAMGLAEYYRATKDYESLLLAKKTLHLIEDNIPLVESPYLIDAFETKSLKLTLLLIELYQTMRKVTHENDYNTSINARLKLIFNYFYIDDKNLLSEIVTYDGERLDSPLGRRISPGLCIQAARIILEESIFQEDEQLLSPGLTLLDSAIRFGWDKGIGGLFNYLDNENKDLVFLDSKCKTDWAHAEMIYATLLAYRITKSHKYEKFFYRALRYSYYRFRDPHYGEWYGWLNRWGIPIVKYKGNENKVPYYVPRMEGKSYLLLKKYLSQ